jgi:hypothetical protein
MSKFCMLYILKTVVQHRGAVNINVGIYACRQASVRDGGLYAATPIDWLITAILKFSLLSSLSAAVLRW